MRLTRQRRKQLEQRIRHFPDVESVNVQLDYVAVQTKPIWSNRYHNDNMWKGKRRVSVYTFVVTRSGAVRMHHENMADEYPNGWPACLEELESTLLAHAASGDYDIVVALMLTFIKEVTNNPDTTMRGNRRL
jgi:hypothetical protein